MSHHSAVRLLLVGLTATSLCACAVLAPADERATRAHEALTKIQADPDVHTYAPGSLARAEQAVSDAEGLQASAADAATRGYVAEMLVQVAGYTATANRDKLAYEQLIARRDALRPGQSHGGLLTLATDALQASPQTLEFKPIGNSPALPPPIEKPQTDVTANVAVPAPALPQPAAVSTNETHPLLSLASIAFAGGTALKPTACEELNKVVPVLSRHVQRPVVVYFGSINATSFARASAVRDYLISRGIAKQRLFVAATSDVSTVPTGGIAVDFQ
jgi:outer membrane protein OmpA-like peptidoglycan-associated protein